MMTITEVYCRINRARGLELVSPEDVLNACKLLNGPLNLRSYDSGTLILQLESNDNEQVTKEIEELVTKFGSISIEECARHNKTSIILIRERFMLAEQTGRICIDESMEGLRFYPNLFLSSV